MRVIWGLLFCIALAKAIPDRPIWPSQYELIGNFQYVEIGVTIDVRINMDPEQSKYAMKEYNRDGPVSNIYIVDTEKELTYIVVPQYEKMGCLLGQYVNTYPLILPAVTDVYVYTRQVAVRGILCDEWLWPATGKLIYSKTGTNVPVRYVRNNGTYVSDFFSLVPGPQSPSKFEVPSSAGTCHPEGPGIAAHSPLMMTGLFDHFVHEYSREHSAEETGRREEIYRKNVDYILNFNRENTHMQLAVNQLADMTVEEIRSTMTGRKGSPDVNAAWPAEDDSPVAADLPDEVDWYAAGKVMPVKDQGWCGSCFCFGTVGSIESAVAIKHNRLVGLSEQQLVDCTWGYWNNGCDGGEEYYNFHYLVNRGAKGIATEESYKYLMMDGYCRDDDAGHEIGAVVTDYVQVPSGREDKLKEAIALAGPCTIGIDVDHPSFGFYKSGIYYEPKCGNQKDDLGHSVLVVGYGVDNATGEDYWLIKNSWGSWWGEKGFIRVVRNRDNNCGVATSAQFPIVE